MLKNDKPITVLGGGLAGCEAAWQLARAGLDVRLIEMRPVRQTPAHQTGQLAELVCSNSLKSNRENSAPGLLKEELRRAGSLLLRVAGECTVPGGQALTVDREQFAAGVTEAMESEPRIEILREEVREIPREGIVVVATGPLTSGPLAEDIARLTGAGHLYFYDAISPIVDAATIDENRTFRASRYGKGGDDYLNCPLDREQYARFLDALLSAEAVEQHPFEDTKFFEACLPIEELARRGRDTLRFGPMKPVGLTDPRTGRRPYAVVQLRQENGRADSYNLVGFQNHLRFGEQKRILRMIPGLENAEFLRLGQIHRNTYLNAPSLLSDTLQLRAEPRLFFAGQLCGTEGYTEAMATGFMAGVHAVAAARGEPCIAPPRETALGSLCHYISAADANSYQPANIAFDLLPPLQFEPGAEKKRFRDKRLRREEQCRRALAALDPWLERVLPVAAVSGA